jgi:formate hydrogenlyase transcriptional activator
MPGAATQPVPPDLVQRYQALLEVSDVIHAFRDLEQLFRKLSHLLHGLVRFDGMAVGLLTEDKSSLRLSLLETWTPAPVEVGHIVPLDIGPAGLSVREQRPVRFSVHEHREQFPFHAAMLDKSNSQSSYTFPLTTSISQLGAMGFVFGEDVRLDDAEVAFIQRVVLQVALAIENALNFDQARAAQLEVERKNAQQELLLQLTNSVVSNLGLQDLLDAVVQALRKVVPCDLAAVGLPDAEEVNLRMEAVDFPGGKGLFTKGLVAPIDGSMSGQCFRSMKPIVVEDVQARDYSPENHRKVMEEGLRSQCFIPFVSRGRCLGVVGLARQEKQYFSKDEVEFLGHVGNQITIALENALNYEAARAAEQARAKERDRLQLLMDINNHLASNLDLPSLLQAIAVSVRQVMQCDLVIVHLPNPDRTRMKPYAIDFPSSGKEMDAIIDEFARIRNLGEERSLPIEGTLPGLVFSSGKPYVAARLEREKFPLEWEFLNQEGLSGGCMIPLVLGNRVVGDIGLGRREEKAFTEDDIEFLMQFGTQVALAVENALAYDEIRSLKEKVSQEKLYLEDEIRSEINFEEIIGESAVLRTALNRVETVATSDSTVLILGETGTGKELIARAIHETSRRKGRTFVKLNCAAIPTGLLESELFGHERGAFTGAIAQKIGRMELANGGTLFLDEVGDIPLELQPKLLRALQEREFERLGSTRTQKADVRFLAATNCDLAKMVADKTFRSDLFYRLNVFPITIPPLRDRSEDIPRLIRYFVSKYAKKMDKKIDSIPSDAMSRLQSWRWPGNVRELENFIERSVILSTGPVLRVPLSELESPEENAPATTLRDTERDHILKVLREADGILSGANGAAARLGVKRTTLQSKMKKLGITRDLY